MADPHIRTALLSATLAAAVPLWIERHRHRSPAWLERRASECATAVASTGDIIQFRSKKRGATAAAFNRLAEGIACAALLRPEGVEAFGQTYTA